MAAATITTESEAVFAIKSYILELSDGETLSSRLGTPFGAILQEAETTAANAGSAINLDYALSGRTYTIRYKVAGNAVTDKAVSVFEWGKL